MYKKILVPVDDSGQSYSAVRLAGLIGQAAGAAITLFHVRKPVQEVVTDMVTKDKLMELPGKEREAAIFRLCGEILGESGVKADSKSTVSDNVAEAIIRECEAGSYDAIVMGHRGRRHLKQLLMGSIAHGVMVEARCAIIMVNERPEREG